MPQDLGVAAGSGKKGVGECGSLKREPRIKNKQMNNPLAPQRKQNHHHHHQKTKDLSFLGTDRKTGAEEVKLKEISTQKGGENQAAHVKCYQ